MVVRSVTTLALYCPGCGKIQMWDFSRFTMKKTLYQTFACGCGQELGSIASFGRRQCLLNMYCMLCDTNHIICIDNQHFWHVEVDKIYCTSENLELGLFGDRQVIEQVVADYERELDDLVKEGCAEYTEGIAMAETSRIVRDIAEKSKICCRCGGTAVVNVATPERMEVRCLQCGEYQVICARAERT